MIFEISVPNCIRINAGSETLKQKKLKMVILMRGSKMTLEAARIQAMLNISATWQPIHMNTSTHSPSKLLENHCFYSQSGHVVKHWYRYPSLDGQPWDEALGRVLQHQLKRHPHGLRTGVPCYLRTKTKELGERYYGAVTDGSLKPKTRTTRWNCSFLYENLGPYHQPMASRLCNKQQGSQVARWGTDSPFVPEKRGLLCLS